MAYVLCSNSLFLYLFLALECELSEGIQALCVWNLPQFPTYSKHQMIISQMNG